MSQFYKRARTSSQYEVLVIQYGGVCKTRQEMGQNANDDVTVRAVCEATGLLRPQKGSDGAYKR